MLLLSNTEGFHELIFALEFEILWFFWADSWQSIWQSSFITGSSCLDPQRYFVNKISVVIWWSLFSSTVICITILIALIHWYRILFSKVLDYLLWADLQDDGFHFGHSFFFFFYFCSLFLASRHSLETMRKNLTENVVDPLTWQQQLESYFLETL